MVRMDTSLHSRRRGRSFYAAVASFPTACFILTWFTDLAYWATASVLWETMSVWLLTIGLFGAGFAVIAGIVDLIRSRRISGLGQPWLAILGQIIALGLSIVNVFVHSRDGYTAVVPQGLILSTLVVVVLVATVFAGRARPVRTHVGGLA